LNITAFCTSFRALLIDTCHGHQQVQRLCCPLANEKTYCQNDDVFSFARGQHDRRIPAICCVRISLRSTEN